MLRPRSTGGGRERRSRAARTRRRVGDSAICAPVVVHPAMDSAIRAPVVGQVDKFLVWLALVETSRNLEEVLRLR